MSFLVHCVEGVRNLEDRQQIYVDIHVGDFKFVIGNKDPVRKYRSPSQLKQDFTPRKDWKPSIVDEVEQVNETALSNNNIGSFAN